MKRKLLFFRVVIALTGIGALALLLWEPHIEGRNAHSTLFEIYFKDPFLAFAYIASIPFFTALYQAFKMLRYTGQNQVYSQTGVKAVRIIKYCAISVVCFAALGEFIIMLGNSDDRAGGVFIGIIIALGSIVVALAAARFEGIIRKSFHIGSGNN